MQAIKWEFISEPQLDLLGNYFLVPIGILLTILVITKKIFWGKRTISLG